MRIVINDIAASYGGAVTVLKEVYNYIVENDKENEYIFLLSERLLKDTDNIKIYLCPEVKKSWLHKLWFDFVSGQKLLNSLNPDVVISLQNIITFGYKGVQKVYIHQSIPFQSTKKFSFFKRRECKLAIYQYLIGAIIKLSILKSDSVFVQTEWMKKSVLDRCRIHNDKVKVIPISVSEMPLSNEYISTGNEFFYPSTVESVYKNHDLIYEACRLLKNDNITNYRVVLTLNNKNSSKNLSYCGMLNKEDLYKEYNKSVLLFPSYIETVGLPLIEAMSVGAVVFVADCEYSHEILKDYPNAYFFDPFNAEDLAMLMKKSILGQIVSDGKGRRANQNSDWSLLL